MASKVVLYRGRRGCGKTLSMVKDGYNYYRNGWKVLSNFKTSFSELLDNEDIIELDKNSNLYNVVIMLDELQILFDSRRSMQNRNISFSNFVQQIRKRNITLLGATQYSNTIDLRFRQHTDILACPNFIKDLDVCEVTYIDVTAIEDNILGETIIQPKTQKIVFDARLVYPLYKTSEMLI